MQGSSLIFIYFLFILNVSLGSDADFVEVYFIEFCSQGRTDLNTNSRCFISYTQIILISSFISIISIFIISFTTLVNMFSLPLQIRESISSFSWRQYHCHFCEIFYINSCSSFQGWCTGASAIGYPYLSKCSSRFGFLSVKTCMIGELRSLIVLSRGKPKSSFVGDTYP